MRVLMGNENQYFIHENDIEFRQEHPKMINIQTAADKVVYISHR